MKLQKNQTDNTFLNISTLDPTVTDDASKGFDVSSQWLTSGSKQMWACTDATVGAAVWVKTGSGGSGSGGGGTKIFASTSGANPVTIPIPGGLLGTNNAIRYRVIGSYIGTSNVTTTISATYGGSSIGSIPFSFNGDNNPHAFFIEGLIIADNSTGSQQAQLSGFGRTITLSTTPQVVNDNQGTSIDSTILQNLVITLATGINSFVTLVGVTVELISDSGINSGSKKVGVGEISDIQWFNVMYPFTNQAVGQRLWRSISNSITNPSYFDCQASGGAAIHTNIEYSGILPFLHAATPSDLQYDSGKQVIFSCPARTETPGTVAESAVCFDIHGATSVGIQGTNTVSVGFVHIPSSGWAARCADGSGFTETPISIPAGTHILRCEYDPANVTPQARFYVDGILLATVTTNVPTADSSVIGFIAGNNVTTSAVSTVSCPTFSVEN